MPTYLYRTKVGVNSKILYTDNCLLSTHSNNQGIQSHEGFFQKLVGYSLSQRSLSEYATVSLWLPNF